MRPLKDEADLDVAVSAVAHGEGLYASSSDIIADIDTVLGTRLESLPGFDPDAEEVDPYDLLKPAMTASMRAKSQRELP